MTGSSTPIHLHRRNVLAGARGNVLRVLPPLIIQDVHVQDAVEILDRTASRLEAEAVGQAAE